MQLFFDKKTCSKLGILFSPFPLIGEFYEFELGICFIKVNMICLEIKDQELQDELFSMFPKLSKNLCIKTSTIPPLNSTFIARLYMKEN